MAPEAWLPITSGTSSSMSATCAKIEFRRMAIFALFIAATFPVCARAAHAESLAKKVARESTMCTSAEQGMALMQGQRLLTRSHLLATRSAGFDNNVSATDYSMQNQSVSAQAKTANWGSCAELVNRGTHFTVRVEVGNPSQEFEVVTDTGSNALIIRSCVCQEDEGCSEDQGKCFKGTKKSSTFSVPDEEHLNAVVLTFGSGKIEAVIATDEVKVGDRSVSMQDALLLMVKRELDLTGPFEGILGLGLPVSTTNESESETNYESEGVIMKSSRGTSAGTGIQVQGFMEVSGTQSFSVCFNDGANGVLRMDPPDPPTWLGSVGKSHWGLDFRGVTVKGASFDTKVEICSPDNMGADQKTPCGAIPDSGTTVIMAAAVHVKLLFEAICGAWPRCQEKVDNDGGEPHKVVQNLLFECQEWLGNLAEIGSNAGEALNKELPSLELAIVDVNGQSQTLTLDPVDYIMETLDSDMHYVAQHLIGIFPTKLLEPASEQQKVCAPAFGVMDFDTKLNGPVWILGTPIFYKYQVGYNMGSSPPGISFVDDDCGECDNQASLMASGQGNVSSTRLERRTKQRGMHQVSGPLRISNFDTAKGL